MAPEQELHERDERNRRRRPAADWGVAEDIFDRMPSRRFKRGRAESQEIVIRRADTGAEAEWVDEGPAATEWDDTAPRREPDVWIDDEPRQAVDTWVDEAPRRGAPRRSAGAWAEDEPRRAGDSWSSHEPCRAREGASRDAADSRSDDEPRRGASRGVDIRVEPGSGRAVDSWVEEEPRRSSDERQVESWLDDEAR